MLKMLTPLQLFFNRIFPITLTQHAIHSLRTVTHLISCSPLSPPVSTMPPPPYSAFVVTPARLHRRPRTKRRTKQCHRCALPDFIPTAASRIEDPAARAILQSLNRIDLPTPLSDTPIGTVIHRSGLPNAPPIVCLHGFDSNLLEFRNLIPLLSAHTDVHAIDLLGWGLTDKPSDLSYGVPSRREHLAAYLRTALQGRTATLIGASLGGAIAADLALQHPDLVDKLILIDAQVCADRTASNAPQWVAALGAEVLRADWLRFAAVLASYENPAFRTRDVLRIGGLHTRTDGWRDAAIDFIQADGYAVSQRLRDINVPTLVVWGDNDRVLPKGDAVRVADEIPGARLVQIVNAGHSPHIEKAADVADAILDFLGRDDAQFEQLQLSSET